MRSLFSPKFMDRRPYNVWQEKQDGPVDWALAEARRILETHKPQPLDEKISRELQQIISGVEKG
jgi:trimethylamine:corrinoid methyltransferase-like protein